MVGELAETGCMSSTPKYFDSLYFDNSLNYFCLVKSAAETVSDNGIMISYVTSKMKQNGHFVICHEHGKKNKKFCLKIKRI
jgi:hypothetical protein